MSYLSAETTRNSVKYSQSPKKGQNPLLIYYRIIFRCLLGFHQYISRTTSSRHHAYGAVSRNQILRVFVATPIGDSRHRHHGFVPWRFEEGFWRRQGKSAVR